MKFKCKECKDPCILEIGIGDCNELEYPEYCTFSPTYVKWKKVKSKSKNPKKVSKDVIDQLKYIRSFCQRKILKETKLWEATKECFKLLNLDWEE